jgi:hypothetical protein
MTQLIQSKNIAEKILVIRGVKVMLDSDLAKMYGVKTRGLIQAVKRNKERFPADFLFMINNHEVTILKSQFVTSSWGGRRTLPYAFTEQGVAMLSSVLNSPRAIKVNIEIMRAFVKMRSFLEHNKELGRKLDSLERKIQTHDVHIRSLFEAIRQLMTPIPKNKKPIGY